MDICVSDHDHDCLTNLGLADDVLLFATSKEQFQKMLCEFKKSSEKWDSGSTQERRKFSATKARTQKEIEVANICRNIGNRRKREILRTADYIPASRNDRNQKSNQGCLGDVSQVQTGADNVDESALSF